MIPINRTRLIQFVLMALITVAIVSATMFVGIDLANAQDTAPRDPYCGWTTTFSNPGRCIFVPFMAWMGSWFLTLGAAILLLAGTTFNMLIESVVIQFGATLKTMKIDQAIDIGWTVFRDLSNILIIGIFVFIAISLILGLEQFGKKKLIANVLIVAVLMNFSLLFTKIIIDASNFVTYQIYAQISRTSTAQGAPKFDLAASFLRPMGITSVWMDTSQVTASVAAGTNTGSAVKAMSAFFFGIVGMLLLITVAAVLFYGSFLIAARAVLMIFLMVTASLAFATYLIPTLSEGEYGWKAWWKALFNNAAFSILLMVFLSISLLILSGAGNQMGGQQALANIISDPSRQQSGTNGWTALLIYFIGTGLLFLSFRMAHKFAGTVSGFGLSSAAMNLATLTPLGGAARLAGLAGRNMIGKAASMRLNSLQQGIANRVAGGGAGASLSEIKAMERNKKLATSSFDVMNTKLMSAAAKKAGILVPGGKDAGKGGYLGVRDRQAAESAKRAENVKFSDAQAKAATETIMKDVREDNAKITNAAIEEQNRHAEALKNADSAKQFATEATIESQKPDRDAIAAELGKLNETLSQSRAMVVEHETKIAASDNNVKNFAGPANERDALIKREAAAKAEHKTALDKEQSRIKQAEDAITNKQQALHALDTAASNAGAKAVAELQARAEQAKKEAEITRSALQSAEKTIEEETKKRVKSETSVQKMGATIEHARIDRMYGTLGDHERDRVDERVADQIHHHKEHKRLKEVITALGGGHGDDHGDDHGGHDDDHGKKDAGHGAAPHAPAAAHPPAGKPDAGHGGGGGGGGHH